VKEKRLKRYLAHPGNDENANIKKTTHYTDTSASHFHRLMPHNQKVKK